MCSKNLNPFKDFQSDQIQRSSRKIFTAHYACRNASLNLTPVTGTTDGFIFQIFNSLIESWGVRLTCFDCNSLYIRSIKERGLVNVYKEDFQSILRKQRLLLFLRNVIPPRSWVTGQAPIGEIFSKVGKTKNSKSTAMCFERQKKVYLKTCSAKRHVFPLRFIYSQAK